MMLGVEWGDDSFADQCYLQLRPELVGEVFGSLYYDVFE
jgi:hypothetical protein